MSSSYTPREEFHDLPEMVEEVEEDSVAETHQAVREGGSPRVSFDHEHTLTNGGSDRRREDSASSLDLQRSTSEGLGSTSYASSPLGHPSQASKVPAAGAGTRVRPRPIPRSSASLRHISSRGRTVSFGTALPEDEPTGSTASASNGTSTLQKRFEDARRQSKDQLQSESVMDSDADDSDQDQQYERRRSHTSRSPRARRRDPVDGILGLTTSSEEGTNSSDEDSIDANETWHSRSARANSHGAKSPATPSKSPLDPREGQGMLMPEDAGLKDVHTPGGTPGEVSDDDHIDARHRLEWHTMLQSVLRSEVLKSETKRITSAEASTKSDEQMMYERWLDIRAVLRGRGHQKDAIQVEQKRLKDGWPLLIRHTLDAIDKCRSQATDSLSENAEIHVLERQKHLAQDEVKALLQLVDDTEEQFPSLKKLAEVAPEYFDSKVQRKLDALYSWQNSLCGLQLQLKILQDWTGSDTLDVHSRARDSADGKGDSETSRLVRERLEEGTFIERLLKENSLKSTFEKRTLRALHHLVLRAKAAMTENHQAFQELKLPPFLPELMVLANFPTRLMEAALRARLDYVGKLTDPSVLIVDALIDDLRAAIALACRIKVQYVEMVVHDSERGWEPPQELSESYDAVLCEALRYFFKLLNYKLKGSLFFKETEVLEPEWRFLSATVEVVEGADILVARSVTKMVNKLFIRIVNYFERELSAPSVRKAGSEREKASRALSAIAAGQNAGPRGPSVAGGLTKGSVRMTLEEKTRWIHQVFDGVRIRSRKLLGFARDVRSRLENAAEYDLTSLRSPLESASASTDQPVATTLLSPVQPARMDLTQFLQTLIDADFFLVLTGRTEQEGTYIIAEPSLHDRPELVEEIYSKCMHKARDDPSVATATTTPIAKAGGRIGEEPAVDTDSDAENEAGQTHIVEEEGPPQYLLALSPRDAFMWTGRVMYLPMDKLDVSLKDRRLRLIADGTQSRLRKCQEHLYSVFGAQRAHDRDAEGPKTPGGEPVLSGVFPLDMLDASLAHMTSVQTELKQIDKGVFMLTTAVIRAVPKIRRNLRLRKKDRAKGSHTVEQDATLRGGDCDDLIQTCFSRASEQGLRALPFIESPRLKNQLMLALARLSIDWIAFICDDCEPTDRKTFKYAVAALEMGMFVTKSEGILNISEDDFYLMRSKVASCVGLLISHFDILGARDSAAKAKAEEERLERERADRIRVIEMGTAPSESNFRLEAAKAVQGAGAGPPPMLNRHDSGMQQTEERWVQKVMEWDAARQGLESEQRLIGRVLDDTRLEDRGLQFLASSTSRIQIRWQQGRFIGGGTFGTVYLGVNLDSGGLMAVKEIRLQDIASTPSMYKQIKDEMSVMEMLSHPNIVEYYGIEVHRDKVYIFEEYCQGGSLAQLLEHGRIEDEVVSQVYTLQMLDGLVYLHSKNVVHRDIKPDNILLDHMGVIKFVDFGAAKVLAKNTRTIQLSRRPAAIGAGAMAGMLGPDGKPGGAASLQGTPMYMSPEVIKGESRGRRGAMDVWSLGCVVLECATGHRPWSQLDNEWAIMFHIGMAQQHPPLPESHQLSELGIDFIRQCLIIDPYERPSAAELREHPWIKSLVEELNAANEDDVAGSTVSETPGMESVQSFGSGFAHGIDTAAGVAAMAATPGTRSVNGFSFGRPPAPSFNSSARSSYSRGSSESSMAAGPSWQSPPLDKTHAAFASTTTVAESPGQELSHKRQHEPGHPSHQHPGSEALIADLAYAREMEQNQALQTPSDAATPFESTPSTSDFD